MIVGRDPQTLDEPAVCRAAIESLAENFSDGVVAPAFWYALLGLPGVLALQDAQHRRFDDRSQEPEISAFRLGLRLVSTISPIFLQPGCRFF